MTYSAAVRGLIRRPLREQVEAHAQQEAGRQDMPGSMFMCIHTAHMAEGSRPSVALQVVIPGRLLHEFLALTVEATARALRWRRLAK